MLGVHICCQSMPDAGSSAAFRSSPGELPVPWPVRVYQEVEALLDALGRDAVPLHARDMIRMGYVAKGMTNPQLKRKRHANPLYA